jgi:hypothetical protein
MPRQGRGDPVRRVARSSDRRHDRGAGAVGRLARPGSRAAVEVQAAWESASTTTTGTPAGMPRCSEVRPKPASDGRTSGRTRSGHRRGPAAPGPTSASGGRAAGYARRSQPR